MNQVRNSNDILMCEVEQIEYSMDTLSYLKSFPIENEKLKDLMSKSKKVREVNKLHQKGIDYEAKFNGKIKYFVPSTLEPYTIVLNEEQTIDQGENGNVQMEEVNLLSEIEEIYSGSVIRENYEDLKIDDRYLLDYYIKDLLKENYDNPGRIPLPSELLHQWAKKNGVEITTNSYPKNSVCFYIEMHYGDISAQNYVTSVEEAREGEEYCAQLLLRRLFPEIPTWVALLNFFQN